MALPSLKGIGITPIIKEIPQATKTVFSAIGKFGKEVGQSIARSFIATSAAITKGKVTATYTPIGEIEKKIFGTNKPIGFKTVGEEVLAIGGEDFKQKWGTYSIPIGMIMAGLDIVPFGVGKKAALKNASKVISKTDDIARIAKTLKTVIKGSDDEIIILAKSLKKVNKVDDVLKIIQGIGKVKIPTISKIAYKADIVDDPVQKVIQALKETKPLRGVQETLYAKARGEKMAKALAVGKKVIGEKGFYAEKAMLAGELPKVQFESIKKLVKQVDIDNLFIRVKDSPVLSEWDKLPAREGLAKLFGKVGGVVPTTNELGLLEKVFGSEFIDTIMTKRPLLVKIKEAVGQLANIPRSVMSSFDLSFGGRQGVFAAPRYRKEFWNSWTKQFKMFGSEKAYKEAMENVAKNPLFDLAQKSKVSFTDIGRIMSQREERFMSQWAEKIPIIGRLVRASSRAYTGFANKFRMDIFSSIVKNAERVGLNPKKNLDLAKEIASFVNSATGRGSLGLLERAATGLNAFFFSPRLMASRLNLLIPVKYVATAPLVRKEYLKSLFSFAGTAMTVFGLAKLAGAEVGIDPRSADFAKIKIGDTRIDVLGGFQQYIRLASQLISGEIVSSTTGKIMTLGEGYRPLTRLDILGRFVEYKEAPIFSFITGLMKGQDFEGKPISVPKEVGIRFVPMVLQDIYDIAKDNPDLLPLGVLGIFGVGLQTYQQKSKTPTEFPSMKAGGMQLPSLKGVGSFK